MTASKILWGVLAAVALLVLVVLYRTFTFGPGKAVETPVALAAPIPIDAGAAARHLGEAIRFQTVSHQDPKEDDPKAWDDQRGWLQITYPKFHAVARRELIGGGNPGLHLERVRSEAPSRGSDGAPGRGAGERRYRRTVESAALLRRALKRRGVGPGLHRRQGLPHRHHGGLRGVSRQGVHAQAQHYRRLRRARGDRRRQHRQGRRHPSQAGRARLVRAGRGPIDH